MSAPLPPRRRSLALPPTSVSFPLLPNSRSRPRLPLIRSSPPRPKIRSACLVPFNTCPERPPLIVLAATTAPAPSEKASRTQRATTTAVGRSSAWRLTPPSRLRTSFKHDESSHPHVRVRHFPVNGRGSAQP